MRLLRFLRPLRLSLMKPRSSPGKLQSLDPREQAALDQLRAERAARAKLQEATRP